MISAFARSLFSSFLLVIVFSSVLYASERDPDATGLGRIRDSLRSGKTVDVIVEFNVSAVKTEAHQRASDKGLAVLGPDELAFKRTAYAQVKNEALGHLQGIVVLRQWENLSTTFVRVPNEGVLDSLLIQPQVKAVHENKLRQSLLTESLPLIDQPDVASAGYGGSGTTIVVLDSGVDYTIAPFNCTSPGSPSGCRVRATLEAAPDDSQLDATGHGTNVSAIAASVAGGAQLAVADVFTGGSAADADEEEAINWAIANVTSWNVVAMNLSLGDTSAHTTECPSDELAAPLADAIAAGIQPIIAAGNSAVLDGTFRDGIAAPACVPDVVSVGAVYDANFGGQTWRFLTPYQCIDATTAANQLPCASQTASFLSLLAPGAAVTAGGSTRLGTSQATPHVAGAWAVMRSALPTSTNVDVLAAMQAGGVPLTDTRIGGGGRTTSRLDLFNALDSDGDAVLDPDDKCDSGSLRNASNDLQTVAGGTTMGADPDGDGSPTCEDICPFYNQVGVNTDSNGDLRGDKCQCSDATLDGNVTVSDLIKINTCIFQPNTVACPAENLALSDGTGEGACTVSDIIAANTEIFNGTGVITSICARSPQAGL